MKIWIKSDSFNTTQDTLLTAPISLVAFESHGICGSTVTWGLRSFLLKISTVVKGMMNFIIEKCRLPWPSPVCTFRVIHTIVLYTTLQIGLNMVYHLLWKFASSISLPKISTYFVQIIWILLCINAIRTTCRGHYVKMCGSLQCPSIDSSLLMWQCCCCCCCCSPSIFEDDHIHQCILRCLMSLIRARNVPHNVDKGFQLLFHCVLFSRCIFIEFC